MRDSGSGRNQVGAALLAEQVADQAHTNGNGSSGFTLELFADLKAHLGRVAAAIEKQNQDTQRLWESIRPLPGIPVPQITTTNGSADFPELLGPRAGYWWFVIQANALTFSAGSVSLTGTTRMTGIWSARFPVRGISPTRAAGCRCSGISGCCSRRTLSPAVSLPRCSR